MQPEGSRHRIGGLLSDISGLGCYIELTFAMAVGTRVAVEFDTGTDKVYAEAVVRTFHPGVGMGLKFTYLDPAERRALGHALRQLPFVRTLGPKPAGVRGAHGPTFTQQT